LRRRREACESNVLVRPSDLKRQTSRSSSSLVKTRTGSAASFTNSSYSFAASATGSPCTVTRLVERSTAKGPAASRSRVLGWVRRKTAWMRATRERFQFLFGATMRVAAIA
jgi:hypothetical protein